MKRGVFMSKLTQKRKMSYTPVIIGLCFLMVFTCLGFCSSTKSYFIVPVTEDLGISRSLYSFNDSCRFVATAVVNIFFGTLINRFGPRKLIAAGFVSLALSAVVYSMAINVFMIYLGGCLLGVGLSWTTTTMVGSVVNRWCFSKKGTIMGAVLAANGLGGALATQIVCPVIESGKNGYRTAYIVIALVLAGVGTLITFLFRDKPKDGQDNNHDSSKHKKKTAAYEGLEYSKAVRMPFFYGAAMCVFVTGLVLQGITGVVKAHFSDVGLNEEYVMNIMSIHWIALAVFKFLTGVIYDKFGLRVTTTVCCTTSVTVMVLLVLCTNSVQGMIFAAIYSIFAGLALPLETIMLPIYAGDLFGEKSYNQVLGLFVSVNTAGYALGAPLINACYDIFGSYKNGFIIGAVLMTAVIIGINIVISHAHNLRKKLEIQDSANAQNA